MLFQLNSEKRKKIKKKEKKVIFKPGCLSCDKENIGFSGDYNGGPPCRCLEREDLWIVLSPGAVDYRRITTHIA